LPITFGCGDAPEYVEYCKRFKGKVVKALLFPYEDSFLPVSSFDIFAGLLHLVNAAKKGGILPQYKFVGPDLFRRILMSGKTEDLTSIIAYCKSSC
jgi:hypothetical protein